MKTKLLFICLLALLNVGLNAQIFWNEATDGDLSDDAANPTGVFTLTEGSNTITADQMGNPRDVDFFAFTVPTGTVLQELIVNNYNGADDQGFIGIDTGATSDVDFMDPQTSDLLGGSTYGTASIDTNILPQMGTLGGAEGFTPPLAAGDYTIWLNQTGGLSEVILDFIIEAETTDTLWDEGIDGDLSDDGLNPSGVFVLSSDSDNLIIANQVGNPRDVDFFTITVPADTQLEQLIIVDYNSADAVAFIGIDTGTTTDVDFNNPNSGDLLGGTTYGEASIGNDILPQMGTLGGATGFTPPLEAGDYTIWLNQTGGISEVTLNFVLGEALSIDDNALANSISVFPNPTQENLQVSSTETIDKIELYNLLGKVVLTVRNNETINISNLANGIYLAHISTPSGMVTKKVVKQ